MLKATREVIEAEISRLADLIGANGFDVVGFASHVDAGCPYIQIGDDGQLHWIVEERAQRWRHELAARQPRDIGLMRDLPPEATGEPASISTKRRSS